MKCMPLQLQHIPMHQCCDGRLIAEQWQNVPAWLQEVLARAAPKKANWDLRRDVAPKLEKLERRTQRAMIKLMQDQERERMDVEGVAD